MLIVKVVEVCKSLLHWEVRDQLLPNFKLGEGRFSLNARARRRPPFCFFPFWNGVNNPASFTGLFQP